MVRRADPRRFLLALPGFPRALRLRIRRALRVLSLLLVVAGLTPIDAMVDLAFDDGAPAQVNGAVCDPDCDDGCDGAGCHGELHHCGCCGPMARVAPPTPWLPPGLRGAEALLRAPGDLSPPQRSLSPPRQPPRAA